MAEVQEAKPPGGRHAGHAETLVTFSNPPHGVAPKHSEAEAAGSRRSLTLTKMVRSNHARAASVSGELTAPPDHPHGESEVLPLPIPP